MSFRIFISIFLLSLDGLSQGLILSKVHKGELTNTPGYNALARSVFILDSAKFHGGNNIVLTFQNLGLVPVNFRKRKSGFTLYPNCGEPCGSEIDPVATLNRKLIRNQLITLQDSRLNLQILARFAEVYEASIARAKLILKSDSIYERELQEFSHWEDARNLYEKEIANTFNFYKQTANSELIRNRLQREQDLALRSIKREVENANRKRKTFKRYVKKGKGSARFFIGTWHLDFGKSEVIPEFHAFLKKQDYAVIQFDTLPTLRSDKFVQIDSFACVPVKRFLYYKELPGYNFVRTNYQNKFTPGSTVQGFRDFTLYFEHNKSEYERKDVEPILNFLQDSSYVVQQAKVHGFASVEGDSVNNQRLQEERAHILIDLIQKEQAEDSIELIEIVTAENWDMFFSQIEKSPWKDWQKKSTSEIKELLEDDSIALQLEPILSPERFSTLKLRLRIKLDDEQKANYSLRAFQNAIRRFYSSSSSEVRRNTLRRATQIRSYVRDAYRSGEFTGDPCEFFTANSAELDILHFYEMRDDLRKGLQPVCDSIDDIVYRAHQSIIFKLASATKEAYPTLLKQAVDIQNFIFEGLLQRSLSISFMDVLNYPRNKRFHYLILNSYYFRNYPAYELRKEHGLIPEGPVPERRIPVKNTFYYILKEIVLNDEFNMIRRSPGYFQFELYDFLSYYSVGPWDPATITFFDDEVNDKVMKEQLNRLMNLNTIICDRQVYQLYLDFHTKAAYHNFQRSGPDNPQTTESLTKLYQYFYTRRETLNSESARIIALTLLWYARKSYNKDFVTYAYDILESQYTRGRLDEKGQKLFFRVHRVFPERALPK